MAFNPVGQQYHPDPLASGGATERPFAEANVPKAGGIVTTLLRLAMRRLPSSGFAAMKNTRGVTPPSNAMKMGSHGYAKPTGSF